MNIKHLLIKNLNKTNQEFLNSLTKLSPSSKFRIFIVGGAVRDAILNIQSNEIDIAIFGDIEQFLEDLSILTIKILKKSEFNTYKIKFKSSIIDIAQTRKEAYPQAGSLPSVIPSKIDDDLYRRDFTINSLAVEIKDKDDFALIDLFNGLQDIQNRSIKIIHNNSFKDDPTRIFRALRFSKRLCFDLDSNTNELIKTDKIYVTKLTPARHLNEYIKILEEDQFIDILNSLNDIKIFKYFLNIDVDFNDINFDQNLIPNFHYLIIALSKFIDKTQYLDILAKYPLSKKVITLVRNSYFIQDLINLDNNNNLSNVDVNLLSSLININNLSFELEKIINPDNIFILNNLQKMIINSSPLISPDELLELGVKKGPSLGLMLREISINKFKGILISKKDEINFVNNHTYDFSP